MDRPSAQLLARARFVDACLQAENRSDEKLANALTAFEELNSANQLSTSVEFAKLTEELRRCMSTMPDDALAQFARSSAGAGAPPPLPILIICVLFSLLSALVVVQLSSAYQKGQSLLTELESLDSQRADRTFSRLVRQLLDARKVEVAGTSKTMTETLAAQAAGPDAPQEEFIKMAVDNYFDTYYDIIDMDQRFSGLGADVGVVGNDLRFPLSGMESIATWLNPPQQIPQSGLSLANMLKAFFPAVYGPCKSYGRVTIPADGVGSERLIEKIAEFSEESCEFADSNRLVYWSSNLPPIKSYIIYLKTQLRPYGLYYLPAAFGIFGAMIFYLRMVFVSYFATPSFWKIFHRVVLSAIAGVVLSLFWQYVSAGGETDLNGFGLFAVAFAFGLSIDQFFLFIDRLVAVSSGFMSQKEASSQEGKGLLNASHA